MHSNPGDKMETKNQSTKVIFEVYEDNAGGLTLFVIADNGDIEYAHAFWSVNMVSQVANCLRDIDNVGEWVGNYDDANAANCTFGKGITPELMARIYRKNFRDCESSHLIANQDTVWSVGMEDSSLYGNSGRGLICEMIRASVGEAVDARAKIAAWDKSRIHELRDILANCDDLETAGVDLSELPTSVEIPDELSIYPVWAVDSQGRALVGAGADIIENFSDVLAYYEYLVWDELPESVREYLLTDNTIGPNHGGVYDSSLQKYYTRDGLEYQMVFDEAPDEIVIALRECENE